MEGDSCVQTVTLRLCLMQDLVKLHKSLMVDLQDSILNKNALNLHQIFISYKDRYVPSEGTLHPLC